MNEQVIHRIFGSGSIISRTETTVRVHFEKDGTERSFLYPDAFQQHLTYIDPEQQKSVEQLLAHRREEAREEAEKREKQRLEALEALHAEKLQQAAEKRKNAARASASRKGKSSTESV